MIVEAFGHQIDLGENPSKQCKLRWTGQMSPEPETVAWIDSFKPGKVFYDIGANIGRFSVLAAVRGVTVRAFEPYLPCCDEITRIAIINNLSIYVEQLAFSDYVGSGVLAKGRSTHTVYPYKPGQQFNGIYTDVETLDYWCKLHMSQPDYIKIDVDGNEYEILKGGKYTLEQVESVLVEVDPSLPQHKHIPKFMYSLGFKFDPEQVNENMIRSGKYAGMANYIFFRERQI